MNTSGKRSESNNPVAQVCICICTYRRPELLRRLLDGIAKLEVGKIVYSVSCVVVDNDADQSARAQVENFGKRYGIPTTYSVECRRNFALVRNHALSLATGDFVALIDDDEVPVPEWLARLLATQLVAGSAGVLGPVNPYFDSKPPAWILRGKLCERPIHPTGMVMNWNQTRTGNVLLKRTLFVEYGLKFDPAFGTGGEDVDFFKRAIAAGHRFIWCAEAPAFELVPPERCRKSYFLKRALLQGQTSLCHVGKRLSFAKRISVGFHSVTALVLYTVVLPVVALGGFHHVMKYLIKLCHHLTRIGSVLGINLIRERNF